MVIPNKAFGYAESPTGERLAILTRRRTALATNKVITKPFADLRFLPANMPDIDTIYTQEWPLSQLHSVEWFRVR